MRLTYLFKSIIPDGFRYQPYFENSFLVTPLRYPAKTKYPSVALRIRSKEEVHYKHFSKTVNLSLVPIHRKGYSKLSIPKKQYDFIVYIKKQRTQKDQNCLIGLLV